MSHELRTPLNSILIFGQQLAENPEHNLSGKQVEFAKTIHGAGTDLLNLISDILDLSKESNRAPSQSMPRISFLATCLRPLAVRSATRRKTGSWLSMYRSTQNLGRSISTDAKRLQQVLKNLLSNAFKFTERGGVRLSVSAAVGGWSPDHPVLNQSPAVIAFEVSDTGIGIPFEKQRIIFEAFQQADASTSRKYGGTGLGLAISRELSGLLGGEIHLRASPAKEHVYSILAIEVRRSGVFAQANRREYLMT